MIGSPGLACKENSPVVYSAHLVLIVLIWINMQIPFPDNIAQKKTVGDAHFGPSTQGMANEEQAINMAHKNSERNENAYLTSKIHGIKAIFKPRNTGALTGSIEAE